MIAVNKLKPRTDSTGAIQCMVIFLITLVSLSFRFGLPNKINFCLRAKKFYLHEANN